MTARLAQESRQKWQRLRELQVELRMKAKEHLMRAETVLGEGSDTLKFD